MTETKFKGNTVKLAGNIPANGQSAPDFSFVKQDLSEGKLSDYKNDVKILIAVPSLDTGVCQMETRRFNKELEQLNGVVGLVVSADLPFAMKRFCETEGLQRVTNASDFRERSFARSYNLTMEEGPLKGLLARAVYVVDKNNNIVYTELVDDITHEPNYEKVMEAVKSNL